MSEASALTELVEGQMIAYLNHAFGRIEKMVRSLPSEQLWVNPFEFGNSVGRIVVHLTGSLNHFIGSGVAGTGYVRDRDLEFSDPTNYPANDLLLRFRETIDLVTQTLKSQSSDDLAQPYDLGGPLVTSRFGIFLVCSTHVSNHIGQMAYLMHALGHGSTERAW
jgi:uncharacterized damage-inducible protein DinB